MRDEDFARLTNGAQAIANTARGTVWVVSTPHGVRQQTFPPDRFKGETEIAVFQPDAE